MSSVSDVTRMSSLVSGLDTEALIKASTANTKSAINKRKQKLQTLQWKQEAYREVIKSISDFQSKYLDILSKDSIRANSVMKAKKAVSSNESLSVSASTSAADAKYTITSVKAAKAAVLEGSKASSGNVALDFSKAAATGNSVKVTLDGTTKTINFDGGENAKDNFLTALNEAFDGITASEFAYDSKGKLTVNNVAGDNVSHIFTVSYADCVGLKNDASNMISSNAAIGSLDFATELKGDKFEFSVNGKSFSFDKDTTIKEMLNTVNKSDTGVKMSFSGLTQSFTLETTATGAGQEIEISQSKGNLVNALFNLGDDGLSVSPTYAEGLTNKTVDDAVNFEFTASSAGFASGDGIIVNGKLLGVTGLTQTQKSEKITVNGSEISAKMFTDADGNDIYKYSQDGTTYYAKKNGDAYETVMSVNAGGVVNVNGADQEDVTEAEMLTQLGIEKSMKEYSEADYAQALNDAYKASFPEGNGSFSVAIADGEAKITFDAADGEPTAVAAVGTITAADTGYGTDGVYSNYSETAYPTDYVVSDSAISFVLNGESEHTITGTGENGAVTIKDLTDSGYFNYDEATGKLSVAGKNKLDIMDGVFDVWELFGTASLVGEDNTDTMTIRGSNAQITVNGVTLESAANTFSIDGTTFGIEDVKEFDQTDIDNGDAEEITVNISKDNSKIKDTVVAFIDAYNGLLDTINKQLSTSRPKSDGDYYDPLTEEQEEEMEQDEIDKWNEKAKQGLLYHDSTLSKVFTSLRQVMSTACGGMTIQDLGIDTSDDYTQYGKLVLDTDGEAKLESAIENYGDEVAAFFADTQNGLATMLNKAVTAAIDTSTNANGFPKGTLTSVAGVENTRSDKKNLIYDQIESMQDLIDSLNDKYEKQQERLWKKYTALETYIATMNNQSSSLFGTPMA